MTTKFNEYKQGFHLNGTDGCCGFKMTFKNGWTISVQWAEFNYAERPTGGRRKPEQSKTAECAVWDSDGEWYRLTDTDDVQGWMHPGEVSELMERVRNF